MRKGFLVIGSLLLASASPAFSQDIGTLEEDTVVDGSAPEVSGGNFSSDNGETETQFVTFLLAPVKDICRCKCERTSVLGEVTYFTSNEGPYNSKNLCDYNFDFTKIEDADACKKKEGGACEGYSHLPFDGTNGDQKGWKGEGKLLKCRIVAKRTTEEQ